VTWLLAGAAWLFLSIVLGLAIGRVLYLIERNGGSQG
jgi:hypothetical protein